MDRIKGEEARKASTKETAASSQQWVLSAGTATRKRREDATVKICLRVIGNKQRQSSTF
jgi:hypothetical protein